MNDQSFAEKLNYWKTSNTSPDTWLDKAEELIEKYGGEVVSRAIGRQNGQEAILMEFRFGDLPFRVIWPALESAYIFNSRNPEKKFRNAARRQAATMLYHDIKSRGIRHAISGPRAAFFEFLVLPDGSMIQGQTTFTRDDGTTGTVANVALMAQARGLRVAVFPTLSNRPPEGDFVSILRAAIDAL